MAYETGDLAKLMSAIGSFGAATASIEKSNYSSLDNILKLSNASLNKEQITNAENALSNLSQQGYSSDKNKIASNYVQQSINNKKFEIDKYSKSIEQASNIIINPDFIDTADEWRDLEGLRKKRNTIAIRETGNPKYESVAQMLSDEYFAIESLYNNINDGVTSGYNYNKNSDFDDDEVKWRVEQYKGRLDKAISALLTDNIISEFEAKQIMAGIPKTDMKTEMDKQKTAIGEDLSTLNNTYNNIAIALGATEEEDKNMALTNLAGLDISVENLLKLTTGTATMEDFKDYDLAIDKLNKKYRYYTGYDYGETPSIESPDSGDFLNFANEKEKKIIMEGISEDILKGSDKDITDVIRGKETIAEEIPVEAVATGTVPEKVPTKSEKLLKEEQSLISEYDKDMEELKKINEWLDSNPSSGFKTMEESKRFYSTQDVRKKNNAEKKRILEKYKKLRLSAFKKGKRTTLEKEILELKKKLLVT